MRKNILKNITILIIIILSIFLMSCKSKIVEENINNSNWTYNYKTDTNYHIYRYSFDNYSVTLNDNQYNTDNDILLFMYMIQEKNNNAILLSLPNIELFRHVLLNPNNMTIYFQCYDSELDFLESLKYAKSVNYDINLSKDFHSDLFAIKSFRHINDETEQFLLLAESNQCDLLIKHLMNFELIHIMIKIRTDLLQSPVYISYYIKNNNYLRQDMINKKLINKIL